MEDKQHIRQAILRRLYQAHESDSPMVESEQLARELQIPFALLRPNLDFSERAGYIELERIWLNIDGQILSAAAHAGLMPASSMDENTRWRPAVGGQRWKPSRHLIRKALPWNGLQS